jgi:hypothetical protein
MPTVRSTLEPDRELVVDERTAWDLKQQNLLVEDDEDQAPDRDPATSNDPVVTDDKAHAKAAEDKKQARREELGEDKGQAKSQAKTERS